MYINKVDRCMFCVQISWVPIVLCYRELARSMHVPWSEYWDFLDAYVDLASKEGLEKLENYLQERQPAQSTDFKGE